MKQNIKKMKNYSLIIALFIGATLFGQQESQFASVFQNPYLLNPAAGGMSDVIQLDVLSRMQWVGAGQGPTTLVFTGHSQLQIGKSGSNQEFNSKDQPLFANPKMSVGSIKHIVGGKLLNDAIGPFGKTSLYGSYAIHLPMTKKFNIGVGLGLGWSNFRINENRVVLYDQDDNTYANVLASSSSQNIGDINGGIVFYGKGLFVGVSTAQVLRNKAKFSDVLTSSNYNRHYYFNISYSKQVDKITLEPSAMLKYAENSPISLDLGSRFIFNRSTWVGFWYRTSNNLVFQVGSNLVKNLYLSYSYEQSIGELRNAASGTHEIQLGMYIGKSKVKAKSEE